MVAAGGQEGLDLVDGPRGACGLGGGRLGAGFARDFGVLGDEFADHGQGECGAQPTQGQLHRTDAEPGAGGSAASAAGGEHPAHQVVDVFLGQVPQPAVAESFPDRSHRIGRTASA